MTVEPSEVRLFRVGGVVSRHNEGYGSVSSPVAAELTLTSTIPRRLSSDQQLSRWHTHQVSFPALWSFLPLLDSWADDLSAPPCACSGGSEVIYHHANDSQNPLLNSTRITRPPWLEPDLPILSPFQIMSSKSTSCSSVVSSRVVIDLLYPLASFNIVKAMARTFLICYLATLTEALVGSGLGLGRFAAANIHLTAGRGRPILQQSWRFEITISTTYLECTTFAKLVRCRISAYRISDGGRHSGQGMASEPGSEESELSIPALGPPELFGTFKLEISMNFVNGPPCQKDAHDPEASRLMLPKMHTLCIDVSFGRCSGYSSSHLKWGVGSHAANVPFQAFIKGSKDTSCSGAQKPMQVAQMLCPYISVSSRQFMPEAVMKSCRNQPFDSNSQQPRSRNSDIFRQLCFRSRWFERRCHISGQSR
ncbi:uncharacterized protein MYCFIDRAFT_180469 [Pseudocercospora fijiensis CIRAD86]|uniref:Uncharacterized protein n=1 Tax=Pseudocercospora fijiensis (strain CIRAD86) TaxID=383855 RepID=M2ZCZ2_PSEFD|nr:uncharacterized protein MYCFIDRAFT_180469 [Pseudocercospora fijiensis CIRAD86]EME76984.1 hypothetical protein MYCFIDRAFT_180469 [Pseudocercospora fijiensis CIRAD86]